MWNLKKYDTNELIYNNRNRVTYVENKFMVTRRGKGDRINWETGISRYKRYKMDNQQEPMV